MDDKDVKRTYPERGHETKGTHASIWRMGLMWLMGLMGLMGCAGEEPANGIGTEDGAPIAFNGGLQAEQAVTRAGLQEKGVTAFTVYGFKNTSYDSDAGYGTPQTVFPGYTVNWITNSAHTTTTNSDGWEYVNQQPSGKDEQTIKFWDWGAKAYRFFGVAGATRTNEVKGTLEGQTYKVTYNANAESEDDTPYYSHLWFSNGNTNDFPGKAFGQPVLLEFIKPLSKVRIIFIFEDPSLAEETELTGMSFKRSDGNTIKMKGEVCVTYPLTGSADAMETFAATTDAEGITAFIQDYYTSVTKNNEGKVILPYYNADEDATDKEYTVLPVTGQGTFTLTVSVNGDPKSTIVPAEFMNWKPGFLYTYIFKVHVDGSVSIDKVQSAFTEWTIHPTTHTVYNW